MTQATDTTDIAVRDEQQGITRADPEQAAGALLHVLGSGDLAQLTPPQRLAYVLSVCRSIGVNPLSRPFDILVIKGKTVLYANKSCAEQLRRIHQIRVRITRSEIVGGDGKDPMYVCTVEGTTPNGRTEEATKYISLLDERGNRMRGTDLANAYAKGETAAKRRLTLAMVGLASGPDPDELRQAKAVVMDGRGNILEHPNDQQKALAADPRLARAIGEPVWEDYPAASGWAPLDGSPDQKPTIEELTPPRRPYQPRARFHCDVEKWRATWFAVVKDTFLDDDDARHDFIRWWTEGWPENRRTDSLGTFLAHATDRQAEQLVNAARETIADRATAQSNDPDGELDGIDGLSAEDADREAASQAGYEARPSDQTAAPSYPDRPAEGAEYDAMAWRNFYRAWAGELAKRDVTVKPMNDAALLKTPVVALAEEVRRIIGEVEGIDYNLALADADEQPEPAF